MKKLLLCAAITLCSAPAFAEPLTVFTKIPTSATAPLAGFYAGKMRTNNAPCTVRIGKVTRAYPRQVRGVESVFKVWNVQTKLEGVQVSFFPGKTFTLTSAPNQSSGFTEKLWSWMRSEVSEGFFGIRGTLTVAQENGRPFAASYSPSRKGPVDNYPDCRNLVRISK